MPTAAERQALLFLAAVAVVGAGARYAGSRQLDAETRAGETRTGQGSDSAGLLRQLAAVDSAQAVRTTRGRMRTSPRAGGAPAVTPPARGRSSKRAERPILARGGERRPPEPIDINRATAEELERLPRVGPALAKRIVAWRDEHGPFASVDALRHVRGIGVTTAAQIAPLVTFSGGSRPFHGEVRPTRRDAVPPSIR